MFICNILLLFSIKVTRRVSRLYDVKDLEYRRLPFLYMHENHFQVNGKYFEQLQRIAVRECSFVANLFMSEFKTNGKKVEFV